MLMGLSQGWAANGELELRIVDHATRQPLTARMQLWTVQGRPRLAKGAVTRDDYYVVDGMIVLSLPPGEYRFRVDRGPEYRTSHGHFSIESAAADNHVVELQRIINMREQGWRSLDIATPNARSLDQPILQASEDLDFLVWQSGAQTPVSRSAPVDRSQKDIPWQMITDRPTQQIAAFWPSSQLDESTVQPMAAHSGLLLRFARQQPSLRCVVLDISAQDLPMWVASNRLDGVVISVPPYRQRTLTANLLTPDPQLFPGERGRGRFREWLYFQLLESGVALTPLAFSRSGTTTETLGARRTYAATSSEDLGEWWHAADMGRVLLSAGPLLTALGNGQPPGTRFSPSEKATFELQLTATLHTKQRISYLEIIKNAEVTHTIDLQELQDKQGQLPVVAFETSGWAILRAVVDDANEYRFSMAGPFYVDFGDQRRISRSSVLRFAEWSAERLQTSRNAAKQVDEIAARELPFHRAAERFWKQRLEEANAP